MEGGCLTSFVYTSQACSQYEQTHSAKLQQKFPHLSRLGNLMARPRTLLRSTKVVAEVDGDRKHKKSKRKKNLHKARSKQDVTWDHDVSNSSDDEPESTNTRAPAGKKRPRQDGTAGELPAQGALVKQTSERHLKAYSEATSAGDDDGDFDTAPDGSSGEDESAVEDQEDVIGGDEEAVSVTKGGMGNVMAKILGQRLDSKSKVPVLAKRKTKTMKEMEEAAAKRAENRVKSAARRAQLTQQFVIPDHTTTDYERQLKKIATRGVVALFNAINKRQHQNPSTDGNTSSGKNVAGIAKAAAVKSASRNAFLNMLKTGVKPESATGTFGLGSGKRESAAADRSTPGGAKPGRDGKGGAVEEEGGRSWSVLKEDYMMGASSMKNWDQESAESELDALGGADIMSDDDGSE